MDIPYAKQCRTDLNHWCRRNSTDETRLYKQVFKWDSLSTYKCKNWNYRIEKIFRDMDIVIHLPNFRNWLFQITRKMDLITDKAFAWYKHVWSKKLNSNNSIQKNHGNNKLMSYQTLKQYMRLTHISSLTSCLDVIECTCKIQLRCSPS